MRRRSAKRFRVWRLSSAVLAVFVVVVTAAETPKLPHFTDVAGRSSFSYVTDNDLSPRKYLVQPLCGGVAVFDYDGDGLMDVFFTNGAKLPELVKTAPRFYNALLRNQGDGTFEDVTEKAGLRGEALGYNLGVAVGDFNNDGHADLFIASAGRNALYRNNGNGTFTDISAGAGLTKPPDTLSVGAAWFDYDGDGLLDLVVANYTTWSPKTDRRCAAEGVEYYCDPRLYYEAVPARLYRNLGGGKFADVTEKSGFGAAKGKGMGISVADFNGDSLMDVFIANDTEANTLFLNKGDGTFEEQALPLGVAYNDSSNAVSSMGSDAKDFDNDGKVDLFYNDLMGQSYALFRNQGDSFRYVSLQTKLTQLSNAFSGWGAAFVDFDNDGWKDLYNANGDVDNIKPTARQHDTMFWNAGGRQFVDVSSAMGGAFLRVGYQRGSAVGDLNNDGFEDLVVTSLNERPRILMNSADNGNHWIGFALTGTVSNRDAIGAKVTITTAAGRKLYNHVAVSVGFMSSSDKRVHFGLGAETKVQSVEIQWPRGAKQILTGMTAVDRYVAVTEPAVSH